MTSQRTELYYEDDGHTYWREVDEQGDSYWVGAPTFWDGEVDYETACAVVDMDLDPDERERLEEELERRIRIVEFGE